MAQIQLTVGPHQQVMESRPDGLQYFPDEPISILSRRPAAYLVVSGTKTVLLQGNTFETARVVRDVLLPGQPTEFDANYAGITSVVFDKNKTILAMYHAEDHVGGKVSYTQVNRAYWSVGLAAAKAGDPVFSKLGQVLSASVKKENMKPSEDHQGIGDATWIEDASGMHYFAYFTDLTRKPTHPYACIGMARCSIDSGGKPGSWKKYYNGRFEEPGLGGLESPVVKPPSAFPSDVFAPHVTYLPTAKKYVMTCNVMAYSDHEKQVASLGGIYYALSDDGIVWEEPQKLVVGHPVPYVGRIYLAHPRLLIESEEKNRASGWLLYCYSENWGVEAPHKPHYLCRRKVRIDWSSPKDKSGGQ